MKKEIMKELNCNSSGSGSPTSMEMMMSCEGMFKPIESTNSREKSQGRRELRLLKSVNLR